MDDLLKKKENCCCLICGDMYSNPKRLECGHLYCYQCLIEKNGPTECPNPDCKQQTVPTSSEVRELATDEEMTNTIRELLRKGLTPSCHATRCAMNTKAKYILTLGSTHPGAMCDHCCRIGLVGDRYKCGVCSNYDLCDDCYKLPRNIVHWSEHIFLKLKKKQTLTVGDKAPFIKDGLSMGKSQQFGNSTHLSFKCNSCRESPIRGTRFQCGMCEDYNLCEKCEKKSLDKHDKHHVFIVLPHACTDPPAGKQIEHEFYDITDFGVK